MKTEKVKKVSHKTCMIHDNEGLQIHIDSEHNITSSVGNGGGATLFSPGMSFADRNLITPFNFYSPAIEIT